MTPHAFIQKWKPVTLTERASAQEHFIDLCRLLDHPTPSCHRPRKRTIQSSSHSIDLDGKPGEYWMLRVRGA
jgi:hypothetical protein